jgi:hypothetical protein
MRSITSRILVPALLLLAAKPAAAQRDLWTEYDGPRRFELAAGASVFLSTDWSDLILLESLGPDGTHRQVLLREFAMAPEFGGHASVTYWKGRHGFRVHAGYVQSCLATGDRCEGSRTPVQTGLPPTEIAMDTYIYGVQGIVGLIEHSPGQWFRPYLIVGAGGVTYDLDQPLSVVLPGPLTSTGPVRVDREGETLVFADDPGTFLLSMDEVSLETRVAVNLGIGTDFRIPVGPGGLTLRLELSDHINQTPLSLRLARLDDGLFDDGIDEVEFNGRAVHNWKVSAGLALEFGLRSPPRVPPEF